MDFVRGTKQENALNWVSLPKLYADQHLEPRVAQSTLAPEVIRGRVKGEIDGRAFEADVRLFLSSAAIDLCGVLACMPIERLRVLLQLLVPGHSVLNWETELLEIAPWLEKTNICLEVVSDIKEVDMQTNQQLAGTVAVTVGSPAHDVGALPRVYVQPRDLAARNTVAKARWTTLARVLCHTLLVFSPAETEI